MSQTRDWFLGYCRGHCSRAGQGFFVVIFDAVNISQRLSVLNIYIFIFIAAAVALVRTIPTLVETVVVLQDNNKRNGK